MKNPIIVISLDFELHWGRFDKYPLESSLGYYLNTRKVIPKLLELFSKYEIHSTWATVGMLMAENKEEWEFYCPSLKPSYNNSHLSAYSWMKSQKKMPKEALFAPDLILKILETPNQELGSHSFSHYYTLERGQTSTQWKEDLRAACQISNAKFGHSLSSLVFPRNQFSGEMLIVAGNEGFKVARTNPKDWFWENVENENLIKKIFRTGDTLFPLGEKTSYLPFCKGEGILTLPASRLLRPFRSGSLFNRQRIERIKTELSIAIDYGEVYHLWWHPHNFGSYPEENLKILENLLKWINVQKETKGLVSMNMGEAGKVCRKEIIT